MYWKMESESISGAHLAIAPKQVPAASRVVGASPAKLQIPISS